MKSAGYILCLFVFIACKSQTKPVASDTAKNVAVLKISTTINKDNKQLNIKPYKLIDDFLVIDTGKYSNDGPMTGGSYAIIKNNGGLIDTIDLDFGIKKLGHQSYFYHKLNHEIDPAEKESQGHLMLEEGKFYLIENNNKMSFNNLTSDFDDYFSSPNVINQKIYFWKLEKVDTVGALKASATEFDPLTHKTKSYFLLNDTLETDDSNHFPLPYVEKANIVFTIDGKKKWKFSTEFSPY